MARTPGDLKDNRAKKYEETMGRFDAYDEMSQDVVEQFREYATSRGCDEKSINLAEALFRGSIKQGREIFTAFSMAVRFAEIFSAVALQQMDEEVAASIGSKNVKGGDEEGA